MPRPVRSAAVGAMACSGARTARTAGVSTVAAGLGLVGLGLWARRDVRREASPPADADWEALGRLLARDPTPPEAATLTDLLEHLLQGLKEREREILVLHLQGYTQDEISARVGRAERTVHPCERDFRQPFMIDPRPIARERVRIHARKPSGCEHVSPERDMAPEVHVRYSLQHQKQGHEADDCLKRSQEAAKSRLGTIDRHGQRRPTGARSGRSTCFGRRRSQLQEAAARNRAAAWRSREGSCCG